ARARRHDGVITPAKEGQLMARVPEPDQTPEGPAYEGRLLDRPDEEVVDQGASFDLRTLFSRRGVLGLIGAGVGAAALTACSSKTSGSASSSSGSVTEIPDETAGPYPADGSNGPDILEQSGIVRSDIRSNIDGSDTVDGVPLTFTLKVTDMANDNAPFDGAAVYAWHCDAQGRYWMSSYGAEDGTWAGRGSGRRFERRGHLHLDLPRLLHRKVDAHPLRGLPRRRLDHRRRERDRHLPDGSSRGCVQCRVRTRRL